MSRLNQETRPLTEEERTMLEELEENSANLTTWESRFVDEMLRREEFYGGQCDKIRQIHAQRVKP